MKKSKKLNIVLDANWYVSACISRKSRRTLYYNILKNPDLQVFYSSDLIDEFSAVIKRPKFSKYITHKQVNRFKIIAFKFLKKTKDGIAPEIVRDMNDNYLLGVCESCKADFLITGDEDLLVLGEYQQTKIVKMGQFTQVMDT
ncbi:putative toxin-antitoxin system toxin component, PIN family [Dyadobacter sp. CY107]|uniref:putative toxin-antitoxin system toxin component, PIN family n=1 Tax=Dyadobacter fanqingshengii TaxID=2906443 RepID=UPI001F21CD11|nr:putative toxin-antitoxin system toxin component, PIN family [Dyadobacter fanqingshengii]MCF2505297.1 putative toxin-antitoxin system toxin component, PIN family [Dyadobacter fanqingshengii]